jgi:hypothetical protein
MRARKPPPFPAGSRARRRDRDTDQHVALLRFVEPGDDSQQGRFAAAGRADENEELAFADVEVDVLQYMDRAELLADVAQFDGGHCMLLR